MFSLELSAPCADGRGPRGVWRGVLRGVLSSFFAFVGVRILERGFAADEKADESKAGDVGSMRIFAPASVLRKNVSSSSSSSDESCSVGALIKEEEIMIGSCCRLRRFVGSTRAS